MLILKSNFSKVKLKSNILLCLKVNKALQDYELISLMYYTNYILELD